jgi:hypothetical protein
MWNPRSNRKVSVWSPAYSQGCSSPFAPRRTLMLRMRIAPVILELRIAEFAVAYVCRIAEVQKYDACVCAYVLRLDVSFGFLP